MRIAKNTYIVEVWNKQVGYCGQSEYAFGNKRKAKKFAADMRRRAKANGRSTYGKVKQVINGELKAV
jgi:hypothetical protein